MILQRVGILVLYLPVFFDVFDPMKYDLKDVYKLNHGESWKTSSP